MAKGKRKPIELAVYQCPVHEQYFAIGVNYPDGSGTLLTSRKCCRHWIIIRRWAMGAEELRYASRELSSAAEAADRARKG